MDEENEQKISLSLSLSLSTINTSNDIKEENHRLAIQKDISIRSREEHEEECNVSRKKLRLTDEQHNILEHSFRKNATVNPKQKEILAKELNLQPRQVEVWFQNRRARTRIKQTEANFESMRRYCQELTNQNKRMQKELQHLKALKSVQKSSVFYMQQPTEATGLEMCPSCKKILTTESRPN